jgi:hypothetical protein
MCPCGLPLHYSNPYIKAQIDNLIRVAGETMPVSVEGKGTYIVSRHYIALHGLRAQDVDDLAAKGIITKVE